MADDQYHVTDSEEDTTPVAGGDLTPLMPPLEFDSDVETMRRVLDALKRAA